MLQHLTTESLDSVSAFVRRLTGSADGWQIVASARWTPSKARLEFQHDGQIATVVLVAPPANILDQVMMVDLCKIFEEIAPRRDLKAVVVTGDGPNFSYGASIQEHLPERIADALGRLRRLLLLVAEAPAPTIAAVRGQCLGGGFELVLACDLVFAEETARLGCPEIMLGVFPPAASALLPVRVGSGWASNMVLTGDTWTGARAAGTGLVSRLAAAGELDTKVGDWLQTDFLPRSAAALHHAARAIRAPILLALEKKLPRLERTYLDELMVEPDAVEGIRPFLEKRSPVWGQPNSKLPARPECSRIPDGVRGHSSKVS